MLRRLPLLILAGLVALAVVLFLHWQPERQVRLHQDHLQKAIEHRNWEKVGEFLSPDYRDRWGETRDLVLERLPKVFANFYTIGFVTEDISTTEKGGVYTVSRKLRVSGSGGPIAQYVMSESAELTRPFTFKWVQTSWKPWDWQLITADQPEIEIPAELSEMDGF